MVITATEFKSNLGKYLELASEQDILITKNGSNVARLTSPLEHKISLLDELVGIIPQEVAIDEKDIKEERLSRK